MPRQWTHKDYQQSERTPWHLRLSTYLILAGVIAVAVLFGQDKLSLMLPLPARASVTERPAPAGPGADLPARAGPIAEPDVGATAPPETPAPISTLPPLQLLQPAFIARAAVLHTTISHHPRLDIITYTVEAGDTVFGIADQFGISPETILWANGELEQHPDDLSIGQVLTILPVSGVYYKVLTSDIIESIAKRLQVKPEEITQYPLNDLGEGQTLKAGAMIIVPGGEKPYVPRFVAHYSGPVPEAAAKGTGSFGWPTSGYITQGYWTLHRALDIGAAEGAPAYAADSGYVVFAGWDATGYGNLVILDHSNGYVTYYAHLSKITCALGDSVAKGQLIGRVGSTGRSTGSHLHFEIRANGVQRNPIGFLP